MEHLLTQAAQDLSIRSQVEETLTSILHDVETAHTLQHSLDAYNEIQNLKEKHAALRLRYEEREAVWELERREKERLGVALLEEIVKLSARGVREEKERRALEVQLQRLMVEGSNRQSTTVDDAVEVAENSDGALPETATDNIACNNELLSTVDSGVNDTKPQNVSDEQESATEKEVDDAPKETTPALKPIAPVLNKETIHDDMIKPHQLNETILMNIFSYSDPFDVMNLAQINKAMFTRIDTLFGMGSTAVSSNTNEDATAETPAPGINVDSSNTRPPLPPTASTQVQVVQSSASVASGNSQSTGTAPKTSPKLFAMPSPSIPSIVGPSSGSSWLPSFGATAPTQQPAVTTSSTTPTHTRTPSSGSASTAPADTEIKLNAAMANSMASKLTPAELSVILRMREKLQKCEADAARWRQEKEDAVANLASVEAVKEFLVTRVRDTETTVENQKANIKEIQRKNLADQEVIVFLDERVKKLESEMGQIKSKEDSIKQDAAEIVAKNEKKVRVLSDMLRFEREQMSSNEKEWKNTKKVLVKEVKSCRSHIVTLEAELEGLRKQNEQLKAGLKVLSPPRKGPRFQ